MKMKRKLSYSTLICVIVMLGIVSVGCDFFKKDEISPENLPPVPEACAALSNQFTHALKLAYSSVEVSQLQLTRVANQFAQCMEGEGLSEAEARGIIKNIETTEREQAEKDTSQEGFFYR